MFVNEHIVDVLYFDTEFFQETEWYRWELVDSFKMVYVVIGILGPLGLKWIFDKLVMLGGRLFGRKESNTQI